MIKIKSRDGTLVPVLLNTYQAAINASAMGSFKIAANGTTSTASSSPVTFRTEKYLYGTKGQLGKKGSQLPLFSERAIPMYRVEGVEYE